MVAMDLNIGFWGNRGLGEQGFKECDELSMASMATS